MTAQFASRGVEHRILDHDYQDTIGDYWAHGGCVALVMRHGGGDQCGHSYAEHPKPWVWHGERFQTADPEGQDFDFRPSYDPEPTHNPVNRILAELTAELGREKRPIDLVVTLWHSALLDYDLFGGYAGWSSPHHPYHVLRISTDAEREHAKAVLERFERVLLKEHA